MPWYSYVHPVYGNILAENFGAYFYYFISHFMFQEVIHEGVLDEFEYEKQKIFGDGNREDLFVLGLQIRWGRGPKDFYLSTDADVAKFWTCGASVLQEQIDAGKKVIVFLATDTLKIRQDTIDFFATNLSQPIQVLHIEEEHVERDGKDKVSALVDLMLLAECDELVVTTRSTFGWIPHAMMAHNPLTVNRVDSKCFRRKNSQAGLLFRGGLWPWGTSICSTLSCCDDTLVKGILTDYFQTDLI
jgi:hypothetical protein